ncbi:ras-related and estrogen-regulated growth inhibitor-like [Centruroides vittatus]|uniref:ras-related and estrogen-regulated growth inhibitor-like n=1 Tax=Centruroides sculpturatus TaxID=218467 RepID=UPI000C6CE01E|nr:ras-related and estrogen-regulated growth inhibitor-like [Centruroides sculpturatus]
MSANNVAIRGIRRRKSTISEIKIAVFGSEGVGKSALIVRFLTKRFIGEYDHQTENIYRSELLLDGDPVLLEILDTCPNKEDPIPTEETINWADGYMLVYSVTDRSSFDYVRNIRDHLYSLGLGGIPLMILANKKDLVHMRQVSCEEGEILVKDSEDSFVEVAASEQVTQITRVFYNLCHSVHTYRRRSKQSLLDRMLGNKNHAKIEGGKK